MHKIVPRLLERRVSVLVVGCGGTGSAVAGGLPWLHQALLAFGHPGGLDVHLMDGDRVSPTNTVRQPFSRGEVGEYKAVVLATRMNLFYGLDWKAHPVNLTGKRPPGHIDLVIGCVDTPAARRAIAASMARPDPFRTSNAPDTRYWLDFGNGADFGQFVLGQVPVGKAEVADRLPTAPELYPEIVTDPETEDGPSCSAAEALTRQAPFVNQVLANHGLALLARLFRYGQLDHHGGFVNLVTGRVAPIPVPPPAPAEVHTSRPKKRNTRRRRQRA